MFLQFVQTQDSVPALQAPNIKSKHTPDPEGFTGNKFSIKQIQKCLKIFRFHPNHKMTLNLNCKPTPEVRIAYIFSHTSETAQGYHAPKILGKYYQD